MYDFKPKVKGNACLQAWTFCDKLNFAVNFYGGFCVIGQTEIIVIVIVVLVLFGATAIPKFARSLGQAKKEFTAAMKESEEEAKKDADTAEKKA